MKKNKKIIALFPSFEGGGVEKNFIHIINYLKKNFFEIYIISGSKIKNKMLSKDIKILYPKKKIYKLENRIIKNLSVIKLFIQHFWNENVLIFSFQSSLISIILAKLNKNSVILRLNTDPKKYIKNFIKKFLFSRLYKLSDKIIVNSDEFKKNLFKILNIKSEVILNPFKREQWLIKKIDFFENYKGLKILNIGRLTDQKNQKTLLKAALELKRNNINFRLCIIGRGYKYEELYNAIKKTNLKKHVRLLGYKKNAFSYIKCANLFILTSKYEGSPNVLLESQYAGVPIISSDCPSGPKEILLNGKLGTLFKVNDHKALCKKIINFLENKTLFKKKAILAKKKLYRFDYHKNLNKYKKLIQLQM